jgi:hypothetical protein
MTNTPDNNDRHDKTGGWIEWSGGNCPTEAGAIVQIRLHDGNISTRTTSGLWDWGRNLPKEDWIVAYRILPPKPHHFNQEGK